MSLVQDLALSYRILAEHGVVDAYGHVSLRSPANPERYLLSRALAPELVTEADIMEFDLDSNPVEADGRAIYLERFIHGEIYKLRSDVQAIVHNHSPSVIPFGVTDVKLKPLFNTAAFVGLGVPTFEIRDFQESGDIIVKSPHLGRSLGQVLGDKPAALMRGHGSVVVGDSLPAVVIRSIYLELSARLQMQAMLIAGPQGRITFLDEREVAETMARQDSARTWTRSWELWRSQALQRMTAERRKRK
jgi:ribulose-5-phosphate 4-epimerase/fuculose-1-phosphate aldolase